MANTKQHITCIILIILITIMGVHNMPDYMARIPNGFRVPHPCYDDITWRGVGHESNQGAGTLNPFGQDFRMNEYKWDDCLCMTDSDGDGRSNGEELGDPNCVWTEGDDAESIENLGHPGICEPIDSPQCEGKNNWEVCAPLDLTCEGLEDPATEEVIFRFPEEPPTVVPDNETSYYCYAVDFDPEKDLHLFAMTAVVDNELVVHHIDLNACEDQEAIDDARKHYDIPRPCSAMNVKCNAMVAAWGIGINGICLPDNVGLRAGKFGIRTAILRIHYHNPFLHVGEVDTSGLRLFATTDIRENSASVINLGNRYLEIPPGQEYHEGPVFCEPFCTNHFKQDIHVVFATMHMHLLGIGGHAELYRNGTKVQDIMVQDFYDYNSPHIEIFDPPITIRPGDTIRHVCKFQSLDRTEVTWRGKAVTDEMCHLYLVHYPVQLMTSCGPDGLTGTCRFLAQGTIRDYESQNCDYDDFKDKYNTYMRDALMSVCDITGEECRPGCADMLNWAMNNHSCLMGDAKYSCFRRNEEFMYMQSSCKDYPPPVHQPSTTTPVPGECYLPPLEDNSPVMRVANIVLFSSVAAACLLAGVI